MADSARPRNHFRAGVLSLVDYLTAIASMPTLSFTEGPFNGHRVDVPAGGFTIGRHRDCHLRLADHVVSGRHAKIVCEDDVWTLTDLNSSNGTFVNDASAKVHQLEDGDVVSMGKSKFCFELDEQHSDLPDDETSTGDQVVLRPGKTAEVKAASDDAKTMVEAPGVRAAARTRREEEIKQLASEDDIEIVQELNRAYADMTEQLSRVIVGQQEVIDEVLMAIFCRGHCLLVGAPGLAKTLLVSTISQVLDLNFKRIQFTPDLMPADITGTDILEEDQTSGKRFFRFVQGPLFANMVLADEINRTPPKTQAALLEAMQEHRVTVGEQSYKLPQPFFVLATQNPIEQEGTYPLPEAQLDRFMFNIIVDYPTADEESQIIKQVTGNYKAELDVALTGKDILTLQDVVRRVPAADHVIDYARDLARSTRPKKDEAPDFVQEMVAWGAGPRAGISLITAAKARAILQGRFHATTEDVNKVALPVLRHRVLTTFNAEAAGVTSDELIRMLVDHLKPKYKDAV
jgi:MoxR-like ATPase